MREDGRGSGGGCRSHLPGTRYGSWQDEEFNASILQRIRAGKSSAAYAVSSAADQFCRMFAQMEDPYLRERASDVRDAAQRVIRILQGGVCSCSAGG